eukprot:scaffold69855_cov69-Phaeocystis_antarctica.AAC.4
MSASPVQSLPSRSILSLCMTERNSSRTTCACCSRACAHGKSRRRRTSWTAGAASARTRSLEAPPRARGHPPSHARLRGPARRPWPGSAAASWTGCRRRATAGAELETGPGSSGAGTGRAVA